MIKSHEFGDEEFKEILKRSAKLVERGYFTGINFIQSNISLPNESIVIHFLQDSRPHLEQIVKNIEFPYQIVPRFTYYRMDRKYLDKKDFKNEYKDAQFYDENFNPVSLIGVIENPPKEINVANNELDLIIPLSGNHLSDLVITIQEADDTGPFPLVDPVIIIQTKKLFETLPGFENMMHYVGIMREKEEFYTIIHENSRALALKKYLSKICKEIPQIGKLNEKSITFDLSQINKEFFDYIVKNILPFEPLE